MLGGLPGSKQKIGQSFPRGTNLLFWQAAAPIGWTKLTTQNDKLLRVVNGTGGPSGGGGSNAFSTVNAQTVVGNTTLSASQIPSHTHGTGNGQSFATVNTSVAGIGASGNLGTSGTTLTTDGGSGGAGSHNHTMTMSILYIDVILCSKN